MSEFDFTDDETDNEIQPAGTLMKRAADNARQAAMDPDDGLGLGD
jgi:type IV secretion system protein VirD4